jgi:hypothetical protein
VSARTPFSPVVLWWLLAVSASFLVGFLLLTLLPEASGAIWGVGIVVNVGLAVAVGAFLGWTRQWLQVVLAVPLGSIVTILGLDLLALVPTPTENAHAGWLGLVGFDGVAVLTACFGMAILTGVGASVGVIGQILIVRSGCLSRLGKNLERRRRGFLSGWSHFGRISHSIP